MTMKTYAFAAAVAVLAASCSQVLGLKDPTLDEQMGNTQKDAAIDAVPADAPPDMAPAGCVPATCPFGCDPNSSTHACLPAKLWVFPSKGLYVGDGFGGKDNTVRATSDTLCLATANEKFPTRACGRNRTHAVLEISDGDSLNLMATRYQIPTDVPVHRADDDVRVFAGWNDLIDLTNTKPPAGRVTNDTPGVVWSGAFGNATCNAWTSSATAQLGTQGDTTLTSANWLSRKGGIACDQLAKLLCVCWSGGD
jgi:hypothetical protein